MGHRTFTRACIALLTCMIAAGVASSWGATSAFASHYECYVEARGTWVGRITRSCDGDSTTTFASLDQLHDSGTRELLPSGTRVFRGWGRVAHTPACEYDQHGNAAVCGWNDGSTESADIPAYKSTGTGWKATTLRVGTWMWLERGSDEWELAYANGSWYAVAPKNLEAYCQSGALKYSNCALHYYLAY